MLSPYKGTFRVSQAFLGAAHQGLDLVGMSDKRIYCPVSGTVVRAGWENPLRHGQGWGRRVVVAYGGGMYMYFGHLSTITVKVGAQIAAGTQIGVEGSTGYSTGSHCHWEIRYLDRHDSYRDISAFSGIPNVASGKLLQAGGSAEEQTISAGARVKVRKGSTTYTGGKLASWVYVMTYTVMSVSHDRAVIGRNGAVTAAVNVRDIVEV